MMKGALSTPVWFNEFQAGNFGFYGEKGRSRMLTCFGLLNGGQAMLAWTFNSHPGGEEQIIFGLVDHNDRPSWKLAEWGTISKEFQTMQKLGFPRETKPEIAVSYSWESRQAASRQSEGVRLAKYYGTSYRDHKYNAFGPLYNDNLDVAVINVGHEDLARYKLVVIPGPACRAAAAVPPAVPGTGHPARPRHADGVYARVVDGRTLYVNTTRKNVEIGLDGQKKGILSGKSWGGKLQLGPNGVDIVE
jgi:beta-galactosidase